jgi:hypothetical protein
VEGVEELGVLAWPGDVRPCEVGVGSVVGDFRGAVVDGFTFGASGKGLMLLNGVLCAGSGS